MVDLSALPLLNAFLNSASTFFLLAGHRFIRKGDRIHHRKMMLSAFTTSSLFLVSYLVYHITQGTTHFQGEGLVRPLYFLILGTHTVLAALLVPLVFVTLYRALKGKYENHRRIARWTYPVWLYVSVTGVVIYLLLYQIYPVQQAL